MPTALYFNSDGKSKKMEKLFVVTLTLLSTSLAQISLPCPNLYIYSRAEWGARDPVGPPEPIPDNVTI